MANIAQVEGIASVHLDYIRYPDVILPRGLWDKYGLTMNEEHADFDFCYCDECTRGFKEQTRSTVNELTDPTQDIAWRTYRYQSITQMVALLADTINQHGKLTTAAVFPYPALARKLVRQSWSEWKLDAALPMAYQSFYLEDVDWVGTATAAGVAEVEGRFPIHTGLYVPELSAEQLAAAIAHAKANGAAGVALFDVHALQPAHLAVLKQLFASENQ